jgi:hypothetical protein
MMHRPKETLMGKILLGLHAVINIVTQDIKVFAEGIYEKK